MRRSEAAKVWAMLAEACSGRPLDEQALDMRVRLIEDLDRDAAEKAALRWAQSHTWVPSVAEFRAAVTDVVAGPAKPPGEAWGEAKALVSQFGWARPPDEGDVDDPLILRTVDAVFGSWQDFCASPLDHEMADRARFIDTYQQYAQRAREDQQLSPSVRDALAGVGRDELESG